MAATEFAWERDIRSQTRWVALAGYGSIALLVGCFGYWAATAPLSGAAVAPGTIAAAGRNVRIQHLEGGIIKSTRVEEGDRVKAGQELILLDDTTAKTQVNRLSKQFISLSATAQRLVAERDGAPDLTLDDAVATALNDGELVNLVDEQRKEFEARLDRFRSEQDILNQRVATLQESLIGLAAQKQAIDNQLSIVADELKRKKSLVDQGLTNHFEYTQIQRNQADLIGQAGSIESELASTRSQIVEAREQIERSKTQRVEQAVSQLAETRASFADIEEQLSAAKAVLLRTIVRSPTDGIVVSAVYNSPGAVVAPGEKVIEILPTSSHLIVEAKLSPRDIDSVHAGQDARLRLTALNTRLTPDVAATVIDVSADRLMDENTHEPYYRAKLRITDDLPAPVTGDQLYPGMPVEAFISTGNRTFLEYLVRPVMDSFHRAFVEE
ncbi:HlyD family type I secretion periplasmic adaptor subunit [Mesorhizobium sp. CO1-1-4]|uniref:HlyD family type I secretion periplasmic adaptor subunit n=1 Tax=Mesorhizobium sp. CO1-1-4 TaxID=2876633 RepID=UPI001CCAB735|nr:HlyD family type I secretion periplasmic adaptor subunit [Mesorhizobium sp. CO1-1-4]MBZ9740681.1 HlyD family type I secretion periplasmic adaptor subunit [Mesorhizobium sp. CO1-1-4]